jgi:AcrR family transcriptional regulator
MSDEHAAHGEWSEGLRERKKRLTRQLITDTATAMFLERGFDDVRVTEVADACGVSEKTVYNYFPTKESLLLDREPEVAAAIWRALGPASPPRSPVAAMHELLGTQLAELYSAWVADGMALQRRFSELIEATPSLQSAQREMGERLERTAAEALAAQSGISPDDPEARVAAAALMGLARVFFDTAGRVAREDRSPEDARRDVAEAVDRAALVIESGLWALGAAGAAEQRGGRQQFKTAADSAQLAGRQVVLALRQAHAAWEQMQHESGRGHAGGHEAHGPGQGQGLAGLIGQAERWKRDWHGQQDQWKQAYREQQSQLRQAQRELQRELQQRLRGAAQQRHQSAEQAAQLSGRHTGPQGTRRGARGNTMRGRGTAPPGDDGR